MSSVLYRINHVLSCVVANVPLGTNLGLFHLLWTLLSGRLLESRGAVIPALADFGLGAAAVRRAWAALAGSILAYIAATQPALSTGFWDRAPRPTSGRLRRLLAQVHLQDLLELPQELRKKPSPTAHLPTGVGGHRRQKRVMPPLYDQPYAA